MSVSLAKSNDNGIAAAYMAAAVAVLIWGATPAATKIAVTHFDPLIAAVLRTVIAGIIIFPVLIFGRLGRPGSAKDWLMVSVAGFCGFIGFTILFSYGVERTSGSHAALINAGIPVFTGIFGVIAERRIPGRWWFVGVALAIVGETLLITYRGAGDDGVTLTGDLLCVLSSASSGLCYVVGAHLAKRLGAVTVTFWAISLSAALMLPVLFWVGGDVDWSAVAIEGWNAIIYLAIISSVLGFVCWYWALARGGAVRMGTVQFAMPLISLSLAVGFLGEVLTLPLVLSAMIIVAGIAVARRG